LTKSAIGNWQSEIKIMDSLFKDLRYVVRSLLRHKTFTAITVGTLALGIGANTAIFSLVNAVLMRPLPFPESDRLVLVYEDASAIGFPQSDSAPGVFNDWRQQQSVFDGMAALDPRNFHITGDGEPEKVSAFAVTANLFSLLGVKPALGRDFLAADDQPGAHKVAIISNGLWQRRYGGDPSLLNREILLNGEKYSVIGIMPRDFQFIVPWTAIWTPAAFDSQTLADHDNHYLNVVARLKRDVTIDQARADMKIITERIIREHPEEMLSSGSVVLSLGDWLTEKARRPLILLLVAVGLVLLIACANVGNLMLSRAASRQREFGVRMALGAKPFRVIRQLLTESVLLSAVGGALGLLLAVWSFTLLKQLVPTGLATTLQLNLPVLGFTLLLSFVTGMIFGLAPALQASRIDLNHALKLGGRSTFSNDRLRSALTVGQMALALVLTVGAVLLMQTVVRLRSQYSTLRPENLLTVRTNLAQYKYSEPQKRIAFYDRVLERVKTLPGVSAVGYTTSVPLQWKGGANGFTIEGRPPQPGIAYNGIHRQISAGYFQTMGVPLVRGRYFEETDDDRAVPVAIINETMARQYWLGEEAIGKRFKLGVNKAPWVTIVGVVADMRQMGMDVPVKAEMFFPYRQIKTHFGYAPRDLVLRTGGDPLGVVAGVRQVVHEIDPDQPVSNVASMETLLTQETGPRRLGMILLSAFAGLAILLASLGIYGVLSYFVAQRTPEIGVRMALGAQRGNVLRLVMRKGLMWTVTGVAIGVGVALALTRFMSSLLFEVSASDPLTFAIVPLVLIVVALLACYIPARRATKVDPLVALRYE
jgi:putative ABC transport system permease protein